MRVAPWLMVLLVLGLVSSVGNAHPLRNRIEWSRANRKLHGQILDYTKNHGADRRLYSCALKRKQDMYVYLPPGYDPKVQYPFLLWLHGFAQDEFAFLSDVVERFDDAIGSGKLPPMIIAAPDGSLYGHSCFVTPGSFFLNTPKGGAFEDYLMVDVWNFMMQNFSIRPEREAHAIAGVSMGGGAAFSKAIKYRERFKIALGLMPPLNLRWQNCRGRTLANFDPCCWGWKEGYNRPFQVVGRFYRVLAIRERKVINPLFGKGSKEVKPTISRENPIEMLDSYDVRPGELSMFVGYGGRDEFNIDAQVESFLYRARQRGLPIEVVYRPWGRHNRITGALIIPRAITWLNCQLEGYGPTVR